MKKGKKNRRFNIFDGVIIGVVLVLAGGAYWYTHREKVVETKTLTYTMELTDLPVGFSENIKKGDKIIDNVKNYHMGTVETVRAEVFTRIVTDYANSAILESPVPERETAIVTVKANVTETESDFKVEGGYVVKAGKDVSVKGPGYAGNGFVLTVDRLEGK